MGDGVGEAGKSDVTKLIVKKNDLSGTGGHVMVYLDSMLLMYIHTLFLFIESLGSK